MKKVLPILFFVLSLTFFAQAQVKIDVPVNFTVTDTHGEQHTLFDYLDDGKYVLLDFFFTTCGACIAAMPEMNDAYERYGCNQGDIVFIGMNRGDTDAEVIAYENAYGGFFPAASGIQGQANAAVTAYGVTAFPTVTLIAPNHTFISKDIYPVTKTNLDNAILVDAGISYNATACGVTDAHDLLDDNVALSLFPNPVFSDATIQISIARPMNVKVNIINILGQTVDTPIDTVLATPITKKINFEQFKSGLYFVQLIADGQVISTQRFSKITP